MTEKNKLKKNKSIWSKCLKIYTFMVSFA